MMSVTNLIVTHKIDGQKRREVKTWKVILGCDSGHTRESVQSPLVVLILKVRKGGDFFYGK